MRIALVPTVSAPIRQDSGGSVEAWTWLLGRELLRLGHQVTLFGCGGSELNSDVVATIPGPYGAPGSFDDWQLCEWVNLCHAVRESGRFDVLHSQAYLWGVPLQPMAKCPLVHTLHIVPDDNTAKLWTDSPNANVTAISRQQWNAYPTLKPRAIIPHGVDVSQFTFREQPEDYLLYLGRFVSSKGPIQAVKTAQSLGMRLLLAGPENPYFREKIKPLVDGRTVEYVGFVKAAERSRLLGEARALIYPVQYPESFGLVLVEAMLCGTPVAAINLGAVPEIVEEGVNGFMASSTEDLTSVIPKCFGLNRRAIRAGAERRFSAERMARDYLRVYEEICAKR